MTELEKTQQRMVAGIRFTKVGKLYHFDLAQYPDARAGDYVIVDTARGRHMGQIMGFTAVDDDGQSYKSISRLATPRDMVLRQEWEAKQPEALNICIDKASDLNGYGDIKFVAAQYNYDGSLLTFLYTSEQKLNVSELWNRLKREFPAEIEMRHVGPRDVAKLLGGYGACGELRCCSTFLTDFSPISIKMAKIQGISLNPSEITGMCGRLRCCLVYEYEQYVEARKQLPKRNKRVGTPFGIGRVIDVYTLQDAVSVYIDGEDGGRKTVQREDLIPLDEYEALQKKAKEPCSKHGDEPCDCGKAPGERNQDVVSKVASAPPAAVSKEAPQPEQDKTEQKDDKQKKGRRSNRKHRYGKKRQNRRNDNQKGQNNNQNKNQE